MIVKQIKLSKKEKEKLVRIKAKTGIDAWNILSRWAICISLADPSIPFGPDVPSDSNVEMSWATFAGEYQDVYEAVFRERCRLDNIGSDPQAKAKYFRLHLQRGINALSARTGPKDITELLALVKNA